MIDDVNFCPYCDAPSHKMLKYKERMQEIKQQLPVVQARLDKLAKMKRIV